MDSNQWRRDIHIPINYFHLELIKCHSLWSTLCRRSPSSHVTCRVNIRWINQYVQMNDVLGSDRTAGVFSFEVRLCVFIVVKCQRSTIVDLPTPFDRIISSAEHWKIQKTHACTSETHWHDIWNSILKSFWPQELLNYRWVGICVAFILKSINGDQQATCILRNAHTSPTWHAMFPMKFCSSN